MDEGQRVVSDREKKKTTPPATGRKKKKKNWSVITESCKRREGRQCVSALLLTKGNEGAVSRVEPLGG